MSIWTSLWFWLLVIGIIITIVAVIIWAVTGNADILVGILLGLGVGWIIAGLVFWIFGRPKAPPTLPKQSSPVAASTIPPTMGSYPVPPQAVNYPQQPVYASNVPPQVVNYPQQPVYASNVPPTMSGTNNPAMYNANTNTNNAQLLQQQQMMQFLQANPSLLNNYGVQSNVPPKI